MESTFFLAATMISDVKKRRIRRWLRGGEGRGVGVGVTKEMNKLNMRTEKWREDDKKGDGGCATAKMNV